MIARDGPAQVNNRGRRRDGGLGFTIVRVACGGGVEGRIIRTSRWRSAHSGGLPTDLSLTILADALGAFVTILPRTTFGAAASFAAPVLFRREHRG
jgi:hypothetical protein